MMVISMIGLNTEHYRCSIPKKPHKTTNYLRTIQKLIKKLLDKVTFVN